MILQLGTEEQGSEIWSMKRIQCIINNLKTEVVIGEGMQSMLWEKRAAWGDKSNKQSQALRLTAIRNWILPTTWMKLDVDSSLEFPAQSADTWVPAFWDPPQGNQSSRVLATGPTREVPGYMFFIAKISLTSSYRFEKFYKEKSIHPLSIYCQCWGLPEIFMGHLKKNNDTKGVLILGNSHICGSHSSPRTAIHNLTVHKKGL